MENVDLSENRQLTWLRISTNKLVRLDLKDNPLLTYLDLSRNAFLTSINIPDQPELEECELTLDMNTELDDVNLEGVPENCMIELDCNSSTLKGKLKQKFPRTML